MGWLPMYLVKEDIPILNQLLNQEIELAFLVRNGFNKWIATSTHTIDDDLKYQGYVEYNLWHTAAGPLPLVEHTEYMKLGDSEVPLIPDPWQGWTQRRPTLYFGTDTSVGILRLVIQLPQQDIIPISSFSWIGNHYREIGHPAHPTTEVLWQRLRKAIEKQTKHIPRANDSTAKKEVYAFPGAYMAIQNGYLCQV